jgi:hypothetical protein
VALAVQCTLCTVGGSSYKDYYLIDDNLQGKIPFACRLLELHHDTILPDAHGVGT